MSDRYIPGEVGFPPGATRKGVGLDGLPNQLSTGPYEPEREWIDINKVKTANDRQPGGNHYQKRTIQPWDFIVANNIGFLEGNVIKYVTRHKDKNGIEDLKKAQHYLEKLMEGYAK